MALPPLTMNGWLRYDVVDRLLARLPAIGSVLEIGAGEGAVGARLARRFRYVGLEPDRRAFLTAEERLRAIDRATIHNLSLEEFRAAEAFDLVCAFEVLEHVENDSAALSEWIRHIRPGGWILLSVPAWPSRWGAADEKAGHYRRYDPAQLEHLLLQSGLTDVAVILYGFPLAHALQPVWNLAARPSLKRGGSIEQRTHGSGRWFQPPNALGPLTQVIAAPFRVLQRPFARTRGTGLVALGQRPAGDY